jgi:hypothetical protein
MTVSDEYRLRAADFRAKAEREKDPLFASMFWTMSKTYSRLARHHERDVCTKFSYTSPLSIAEGHLTRRLRDLELRRTREE